MKKIAKIFVFALSMFLCMGYVNAKEFVGVGSCTYKALWGKEELNSDIQTNGVDFYFTDLTIRNEDDDPGAKEYVFTQSYADAIDQKYFQNMAFFEPFKDSFSYILETYESYHTTFKSVYEKTGKCPTNLMYKKSGNEYKPIFTSDDIKSYCGSNTEATDSCPIVLKNTTSDLKIVTDEDAWTINIDGDNSCSLTTVNLNIDADGYIKAKLLVAQGSQWYEKTNKSDIDVYVKTTGTASTQMQDIYQLVINNKFTKAFYRTDIDNEKFYVSSSTYSNNSCNLSSDNVFTRGKTCASKSELKTVFDKYESGILTIYPNINSLYEEVSSPGYTDSTGFHERTAYTYTSESNVASLNTIVEKTGSVSIENEASVDAIKKELNSILDGTHPALNGKKPCQDTIDEVNKLLTRIANTASEYAKKVEVIKEAGTNARKRAEELGATSEELAAMDAILSKLDIIIERNRNVAENIRTSLLSNTNINLGGLSESGCGIISPEMKKFLNTVLWYIRIAGVVLTIILSLLDYIKAATGSDDKSMAAANKKFVTRVVLVAVLFLIPVLLDFLLSTLNISTTAGSISCLD